MKKILLIAFILIFISCLIITSINIFNNKDYLDEEILNQIMYDYNYLTQNSEETTLKYFDDLKNTNTNYSKEFLKQMKQYGNNPFEIVLALQYYYEDLTSECSVNEKTMLDKYILDNSLKFYSSVKEKG